MQEPNKFLQKWYITCKTRKKIQDGCHIWCLSMLIFKLVCDLGQCLQQVWRKCVRSKKVFVALTWRLADCADAIDTIPVPVPLHGGYYYTFIQDVSRLTYLAPLSPPAYTSILNHSSNNSSSDTCVIQPPVVSAQIRDASLCIHLVHNQ